MSDHNGTTVTDHETPAPAQRTPRTRGTEVPHPDDGGPYARLRDTLSASVYLDRAVADKARAELARRYGPLAPFPPNLGLGVLLAEGLAGCEAGWRDGHQHATVLAGYDRARKAPTVRCEFPQPVVDAVAALAAVQFPGAGEMAGRVASAALLHGVALSSKLAPVRDPGLDALLVRLAP